MIAGTGGLGQVKRKGSTVGNRLVSLWGLRFYVGAEMRVLHNL